MTLETRRAEADIYTKRAFESGLVKKLTVLKNLDPKAYKRYKERYEIIKMKLDFDRKH